MYQGDVRAGLLKYVRGSFISSINPSVGRRLDQQAPVEVIQRYQKYAHKITESKCQTDNGHDT